MTSPDSSTPPAVLYQPAKFRLEVTFAKGATVESVTCEIDNAVTPEDLGRVVTALITAAQPLPPFSNGGTLFYNSTGHVEAVTR